MRIVAGKHRGRRLEAPKGRNLRPTADRVRESIFDILSARTPNPIEGARVLDVFAGTGAMGLEALSRGAAIAAFMDTDAKSLELIERNAETLDERQQIALIRGEAAQPGTPPHTFDLVFLDPPYGRDLGGPALAALSSTGWFAPGAVVVVEIESKGALEVPQGFTIDLERTYGAAKVIILVWKN